MPELRVGVFPFSGEGRRKITALLVAEWVGTHGALGHRYDRKPM